MPVVPAISLAAVLRSPPDSVPLIAAEVEPVDGKARAAAQKFEQLGFDVHYVGTTISLEAPKKLWEQVFDVEFEKREKESLRGVEGIRATYYWPTSGDPPIPPLLEGLVTDVHFQEPPEYF